MSFRQTQRWLLPVALIGACCVSAPRADAKILELTLRLHGGGLAGLYGTENYDPAAADPDLAAVSGKDFFKERRGGAFGGLLSVEVFFVDVIYEFYQLVDGNGLGSTLNNFLLGFDWDFPAGKHWLFTPYLVAGFGLATQNNSWLAKKYPQIALEDLESRIAQARLGLQIERKLGRFFRIGFDVGFGYHYMIQTAVAANNLEGHSHGFHVMGNLTLSFVWDVFAAKEKKPAPRPAVVVVPASASGGAQPAPAPAGAPPGADQPAAPARPSGSPESAGGASPSGPTAPAGEAPPAKRRPAPAPQPR